MQQLDNTICDLSGAVAVQYQCQAPWKIITRRVQYVHVPPGQCPRAQARCRHDNWPLRLWTYWSTASSPGMAPSDFPNLKKHLAAARFTTDDAVYGCCRGVLKHAEQGLVEGRHHSTAKILGVGHSMWGWGVPMLKNDRWTISCDTPFLWGPWTFLFYFIFYFYILLNQPSYVFSKKRNVLSLLFFSFSDCKNR